MFPKNAWYVACTPDAIAERPLGRTICSEAMVLYRPTLGTVAALENFCPQITPVPGWLGPMTIAMLLSNTVDAAEWRAR